MEDLKSTLWKIFSTKPIDAEEIIIRIGIFFLLINYLLNMMKIF